jgi:hypothetical protein
MVYSDKGVDGAERSEGRDAEIEGLQDCFWKGFFVGLTEAEMG